MPRKTTFLCLTALLAAVSAQNSTNSTSITDDVVHFAHQDLYLLPPDFVGNVSLGFADTNFTSSTSSAYQELFNQARNAPFLSYDAEFDDIIGPNPTIQLVAQQNTDFAFEAGIWVPPRNEVWFTSSTYSVPTYISVLNLNTLQVTRPNLTNYTQSNPNGGYYYNRTVYVTNVGIANSTTGTGGGIMAINPYTNVATSIVNSYLGLPFNGVDDVTWATKYGKQTTSYMYFTDFSFAQFGLEAFREKPIYLPNTVWRFEPREQLLLPVISNGDIGVPNGIRVNANYSRMYVSDSGATTLIGGGVSNNGTSVAIYRYDLDEAMFPVNKRVFGIARQGLADGLHVDDYGRVWTGEYEGIVVRNEDGRVLGVFNQEYFVGSNRTVNLAQFALAGDKLVVLAVERIWIVQLAHPVVAMDRFEI